MPLLPRAAILKTQAGPAYALRVGPAYALSSRGGVLNYFAGHQQRLNYALRLRRGQTIGSGLVEGSIKQLLNKRLTHAGARWRVEHVGPLARIIHDSCQRRRKCWQSLGFGRC